MVDFSNVLARSGYGRRLAPLRLQISDIRFFAFSETAFIRPLWRTSLCIKLYRFISRIFLYLKFLFD